MRRHVRHFHILGDDETFQPRLNRIGQARLEVQKNFLRQPIREQIALHFALRIHQRGVATGVLG